jgi:hypothetical protein
MIQKAVAVTRVRCRSTKLFNQKFSSGNWAIAFRFVDRDAWIAVKLEQSRWSINRASMSLLGFPRSCG